MSISLANVQASLPAAWRLYLPKDWIEDPERRTKARVPGEILFRTKWQIALDEIDRLEASGVPKAPVLADAGYGVVTEFREGLIQRGRIYAVGVTGEITVWAAGRLPLPPKPWSGRGPQPTAWQTSPEHRPETVASVAKTYPCRHGKW